MPTEAAPIVVTPSGKFLGNDGFWSTFPTKIGTPPQELQLLVSTQQSASWAIASSGCRPSDPPNCADARGGLFDASKSTSWFRKDIYRLNEAVNLGYGSNLNNGTYGFDALGLVGAPGVADVTLDRQVVAGISTNSFYLGSLGLAPQPVNFSNTGETSPSLLSSLKNKGDIPSLSFGYTAGAAYQDKGWNASLVLGGHDTSRYKSNDVHFSFAPNEMRQLVVGLQAITYSDSNGEKELLSEGVLSLLDSTVPYLWLPRSSCEAFEEAFGISWDPIKNLYLVNETIHDKLVETNPTVTFSLANSVSGGSSVKIAFPYGAFDLNVSYPLVKTESRYFPLQRAADDNSYTLGRTFFQEAYMITNFENSTFSISQATFDASTPSHIVPIAPSTTGTLPSDPPATSASKSTGNGSKGIGTGAIAGVAIAIALVGIVVAVAFIIMRKHRNKHQGPNQTTATYSPAIIDDDLQRNSEDESSQKKGTVVTTDPVSAPMTPPIYEAPGSPFTLDSPRHHLELSANDNPGPTRSAQPHELPNIQDLHSELSTPDPAFFPVEEMPAPELSHELESPRLHATALPSHPSPSIPSPGGSTQQRPQSMRVDSSESESGFTRDGMRQFHRRFNSDETYSRPSLTRKGSDDSTFIESPVLAHISTTSSDVETPDSMGPKGASRPTHRRNFLGRPKSQRVDSADSDTINTRMEGMAGAADEGASVRELGSRFGSLTRRKSSGKGKGIMRKPSGKEGGQATNRES